MIKGLIIKGVSIATETAVSRLSATVTETALDKASEKFEESKFREKKRKAKLKEGYEHIGVSSEECIEKPAVVLARTLLSNGFEKVQLKPVKILGKHDIPAYGLVESISVNGETKFNKSKIFPVWSQIVIEYAEFKDKVNEKVYEEVEYITPGFLQTYPTPDSELIQLDAADSTVRFCTKCGAQIASSDAAFCEKCGASLE